jgi:fluoride ion exporter CrcB/FEX
MPNEASVEPPDTLSQIPNVPEEYLNLDELAAPSPVENRLDDPLSVHGNQSETHSEEQQDSQGGSKPLTTGYRNTEVDGNNYANINELVGPPPDENPEDRRVYHHHDLEEARSKEQGRDRPEHQEQPVLSDLRRRDKHITHLYVTSYLIFFSILGTLARLGLQALTMYPGAPVAFSELWANAGGSAIMGYLSEDRSFFRKEWETAVRSASESTPPGAQSHVDDSDKERSDGSALSAAKKAHQAAKKSIPIFIGLSVGFCGSFTSFSSLIRDIFLALSDDLDTGVYANASRVASSKLPRNAGDSVMAVLAVLFVEVGVCLSALDFGAHLAIALHPIMSKIPSVNTRRVLDPLVVFLAWGCWAGTVLMTIWPPDRLSGRAQSDSKTSAEETWRGKVLFAIVLAPLGCLVRFYAALRLNGLVKWFPVGTFAVNMGGTIILGACWDLQHAPLRGGSLGGGVVGYQALQGVQDGFCGCLTTVSTWVLELKTLQKKNAYFYGVMGVGVGITSLVIIMGTFLWTHGSSQNPGIV